MDKLHQGIVIVSSNKTDKTWLPECLASIKTHYPVFVVSEHDIDTSCLPAEFKFVKIEQPFELGAIKFGSETFDEFVFIHDTVIVKDNDIWDLVFSKPGGCEISDNFLSYLGKYDSTIVKEIGIPYASTIRQAIEHEFSWTAKYTKTDKRLWSIYGRIPTDTFIFTEKHGKKRMINEGKYMIKYKGCWDLSMVKD